MSQVIQTFFANFEQASHQFDGEFLAAQFSNPFMTATPDGSTRTVTPAGMLAVTAQRRAFFQSIGYQFVKIRVLSETPLDAHYTLVKIEAHMRFEKDGNPVDLMDNSTYILFMGATSPTIVFYLTHGDFMRIMREHGLLPAVL